MTSISIWSDAFNQVYFTIGFCTGSMVSMGSFQKKESPIFKEVYGLLGANFLNSFFNGFAVFSMVGFLTSIDSVYQSGNRSTALVYITMPAANAELGWTRFFNFFQFLHVFFMGIDVMTANVDAIVAGVYDDWYNLNGANPNKIRREWFVAGTVLLVWVGGAPYYLNTGQIWYDIMDYYIFSFIGLLMCIMQCLAIGWVYEHGESAAKIGKKSAMIYAAGFWVSSCASCYLGVFVMSNDQSVYMTVLFSIGFFSITTVFAWQFNTKKMGFYEWISIISLSGSRKFVSYIVKVEQIQSPKFKKFLEIYLAVCYKYTIPIIINYLLMGIAQVNMETPYGGYSTSTQWIGITVCIVFILTTFIPVLFCHEKNEFEHNPEDPFD